MSEIAELERRITAALERIGRGMAALGGAEAAPPPDSAAADRIAELEAALDAERQANAEMSARVAAIKEKQDTTVRDLHQKVEAMTRQLDVQGLELQRMKKTNVQLRETIRPLREAAESGVPDPALVNKSLGAELEALRATREAEIAEMDEILAELKPLIAAAAGGRTAGGADA